MAWGREWVGAALLALAVGCGGESQPATGEMATGGTSGELGETGGAVPATGGNEPGGAEAGGSATGGQATGGTDTGGASDAGQAGAVTGEAGAAGSGSCLPSSVENITCPDGSEGQRICHYTGTHWNVMCPTGTGGTTGAGGAGGEAGSSGETGGTATGGELATGGATGGTEPTGGMPTGGTSTGGSSTGGVSTGGSPPAPPIGAGRWVLDGTCVRLEADPCVPDLAAGERCGGCWNSEPGPCSGYASPPDYELHSCNVETDACEVCFGTSLNCDGWDWNGCEVGSRDGMGCLESITPTAEWEPCAWGEFGIDHFGKPCGDTCYACVPVCQE